MNDKVNVVGKMSNKEMIKLKLNQNQSNSGISDFDKQQSHDSA